MSKFEALNSFVFGSNSIDLTYVNDVNKIYNTLLNYEKNSLSLNKEIFVNKGCDLKNKLYKYKTYNPYLELIDKENIKLSYSHIDYKRKNKELLESIEELNKSNDIFHQHLNNFIEESLSPSDNDKFSIYNIKHPFFKKHTKVTDADFFKSLNERSTFNKPSFLTNWKKVKYVLKYAPTIYLKPPSVCELDLIPRNHKITNKFEKKLLFLWNKNDYFKYLIPKRAFDNTSSITDDVITPRKYKPEEHPLFGISEPYLDSEIFLLNHFIDEYAKVYYGRSELSEEEYLLSVEKLKYLQYTEIQENINNLQFYDLIEEDLININELILDSEQEARDIENL